MKKELFANILQKIENNSPSWLVTVIDSEGYSPGKIGMRMIVNLDESFSGTIGGGELENKVLMFIRQEKPGQVSKMKFHLTGNPDIENGTNMICGGYQEVLIEPLFNTDKLYIIGAGHCGMALSEFAVQAGFYVIVIDDRQEWANREKHPKAHEIYVTPYSDLSKFIGPEDTKYIAIMTYNHRNDENVLRQCLSLNFKYLGMIGSKTKVAETLNKLRQDGISDDIINKITAPIGLPINSHTPFEIAVSILAQLISLKNAVK